MSIERRLHVRSAALLVVASMVGTGVFTTTGFLIRDLRSAPAVLLGWLLGGVAAFCGALAYGEIAAALPDNGGEYAMLSRIYHPSLGFVAGFVSLFVGFAAPIAASAIAFGDYLARVFPGGPAWWPPVAGIGLIVVSTAVHIGHMKRGTLAQDAFTLLKIGFIAALVLTALPFIDWGHLSTSPRSPLEATLSTDFAIGLVYISFAYTGWNAAAYVAGEIIDPERSLPRALAVGTAVVTVLYLALNLVFLGAAPAEDLAGQVEVGHIATEALFGSSAGRAVSAIIALGLVSTVGAMIFTGPRIYEAMGKHHPRLRWASRTSRDRGPVAATLVQAAVSIAMVLSTSFDALLTYAGATLSLFAALAAAGVFVLRIREPELPRPYRTWGHPITTLIFIALTLWMIISTVIERPSVALAAAGTLALGVVAYVMLGRNSPTRNGRTDDEPLS